MAYHEGYRPYRRAEEEDEIQRRSSARTTSRREGRRLNVGARWLTGLGTPLLVRLVAERRR